jgi:hypothetical protein
MMERDMANEQEKQEKSSKGTEGSPMAMGMAMAKKMTGQTGPGVVPWK